MTPMQETYYKGELELDKYIRYMKIDINNFSLENYRQKVPALSALQATNNNIHPFNKQAHHNSQNWYKAVIEWYIKEYGDIPAK